MTTAHLGAALLASLSLAPLATSQENPPPWWRDDGRSLSLAWDFDNAATFLQPTLQAAPSWYNPANTFFTLPPNVVWIPSLAGHNGVLGLTGTGAPLSASFDVKVDNEYAIDWIKIFWFQFDLFEGSTGEITGRIEQDLAKYGRASVETYSKPIGSGWSRVTIEAKLIPQPDDEKLTWNLIENALGTVAIDNLYVNSKCVKPGDEKGKALGDVVLTDKPLSITTNNDTRAAAVTEGPGPLFQRTIWVSSTAAVGAHQVYRLDQTATTVVGAPIALPDAVAAAPLGGQDMAVETVQVAPGLFEQYVYVLVDRRPGGGVILRAIRDTGLLDPTRDLLLTGFPPTTSTEFGLAFDPSGNLGSGTFWVSDPAGFAYEFSRTTPLPGALLETRTIPTGITGLGYDDTFGYFLGFSRTPRPTPAFGPSQINGYEWSAHDFLPTGVEFCGDLRIPNGAGPDGGVASGFDVYRTRATGELRMIAVARLTSTASSIVYELAGPFRYGWSLMGECGMRGGPPFEGALTWEVTLKGVPDALAAVLYVGFSNDLYLGTPLPIALAPFGMIESYASLSLDASTGGMPPSAPGEFSVGINLPPAGGLSYVPLFFQWVLLDPTVAGSLATSQAGKTIAY